MLNTPVFVILILISMAGLGLGALYYFKPELIVRRRITPQLADTAKKDAEFKQWFELELQKQTNKTRRMGLIFIILEIIWIMIILSLRQRGGV